MDQRATLTAWLNDAYAMERAVAQLLGRQAQRSEDPEVRGQLRWHLEETDRHCETLKRCIEHLQGMVSSTKSAVGAAAGFIQGVIGWAPSDAAVKDLLADYAAEQFEIACYKALIAAAQSAGEDQVAEWCGQILADEERMAHWLDEHIPRVARTYFQERAPAAR
jgi:ferritin-like metal-binding protein YciE